MEKKIKWGYENFYEKMNTLKILIKFKPLIRFQFKPILRTITTYENHPAYKIQPV